MLSYFRWVLFFIVLLVTVIGGVLFLGSQMLTAPGPLERTKTVVIPRGAQFQAGALLGDAAAEAAKLSAGPATG